MAEVQENLEKQIKELTVAVSKLTNHLKGLEHAGGLTRSINTLDTENNHCKEKPTRESGYVNWDKSHHFIKNMLWVSIDSFKSRLYKQNYGQQNYSQQNLNGPQRYYVSRLVVEEVLINENTRFPEVNKLYLNINDPKIQYILQYNQTLFTRTAYDNFTDKESEYKLLTFIENHLHTRSSFEEKYNLIWVDPKYENSPQISKRSV